jgi:hypothetical protein
VNLALGITKTQLLRSSMKLNFEVWAQLFLADEDSEKIRRFFIDEAGIKPKFLLKRLHMTLYHARRPLRGLPNSLDATNIVVPASDTRFMVMAPGGENPRPNLNPAQRKVGIRVQWQSAAMPAIQALRQRLIDFESPAVLGNRPRSTARTSAFGARSFQAHVGLIRAGSGIDQDLSLLGAPFRAKVGDLRFDRFLIETVCLTAEASTAITNAGHGDHASDA